ncbi:MAG: hypothetical protein QOE63_1004 [Acidimicrobiaceae bacterium]
MSSERATRVARGTGRPPARPSAARCGRCRPEREQLREGGAVGTDAARGAQPRRRLGPREPPDLDLRDAAPRPDDRGVQPVERFVGRDAHEDVEALPDEPVGEVEQPRERLACALLRVGADELVTVLQHEQAPPPRVIVVVVERDAHQVAGIVQEPVGVEHAVDLAPRMPRVREGAQRRGLAGAGWTVEQQHPTAERGGLQRHHSLEPVGRGRVVVLPDRRPGVDVDRALDPSRPMAAHVPEADGGLVVTLGRRQLRVDGRGGEDLTGQRVGHRGDGHEAGVVGPPARPQRPAFAGREVRPRAPSRRGVLRDDVRRQERRVRLQPLQALRPSGRLPARDEVDQGEGIDDVAGVVGVVDRDDERGGGGVDVHMSSGR